MRKQHSASIPSFQRSCNPIAEKQLGWNPINNNSNNHQQSSINDARIIRSGNLTCKWWPYRTATNQTLSFSNVSTTMPQIDAQRNNIFLVFLWVFRVIGACDCRNTRACYEMTTSSLIPISKAPIWWPYSRHSLHNADLGQGLRPRAAERSQYTGIHAVVQLQSDKSQE